MSNTVVRMNNTIDSVVARYGKQNSILMGSVAVAILSFVYTGIVAFGLILTLATIFPKIVAVIVGSSFAVLITALTITACIVAMEE